MAKKKFNRKEMELSKLLFLSYKNLKNNKKIPEKELARILKDISSIESVSGDFYGNSSLKDIGLNLAIAVFLKYQNVYLKKLNSFLKLELNKPALSSNYFNNDELIILKSEFLKNISQNKELTLKNEAEEILKKAVIKLAEKEFIKINKATKDQVILEIKKTIENNFDQEMILMPYFFSKSLDNESDSKIIKLCLINILFWTAFIIYDDFWDEDEKAKPKLLPLANIMSRHLNMLLEDIFKKYPNWKDFSFNILNRGDVANFYEITKCRFSLKNLKENNLPQVSFKNYEEKFFPAAGQIIGPLFLLAETGLELSSEDVKKVIKFFKHLLIAKQMNDDLSDFKEDLKRGHLSTLINEVFKDCKKERNQKNINIEKVFFLKTFPRFCQKIIYQSRKAKKIIKEIDLIKNKKILLALCDKNEIAAKKSIKDRESVILLINGLHNSS